MKAYLYQGVHLSAPVSEHIQVWMLGTSSPSLQACRHGISTIIKANGRWLLFDVGRATMQRMYECAIPIRDVDNVFITHLHSDHISGMPDFWMTGWFVMHRPSPLNVFGPIGTRRFIKGMEEMHHLDLDIRPQYESAPPAGKEFVTTEFEEGVVFEEDGVRVTAFLVDHGPVRPAFGFRIDCNGRSIVLSGDTTYCDNIVKYATGCDLLIHAIASASATHLAENVGTQRVLLNHTTPDQLARVLEAAQPRLTLLNHVSLWRVTEYDVLARLRARTHAPLEMGHDRMEVLVGEEIRLFAPGAIKAVGDLISSDHPE